MEHFRKSGSRFFLKMRPLRLRRHVAVHCRIHQEPHQSGLRAARLGADQVAARLGAARSTTFPTAGRVGEQIALIGRAIALRPAAVLVCT
jgi:hypothetical protein